jgi:hypothetical protein
VAMLGWALTGILLAGLCAHAEMSKKSQVTRSPAGRDFSKSIKGL